MTCEKKKDVCNNNREAEAFGSHSMSEVKSRCECIVYSLILLKTSIYHIRLFFLAVGSTGEGRRSLG